MLCRVCGEDKPNSEFSHRRDSGKYRTNCGECRANTEAAKRYGITLGDVEQLKVKQDNRCAICGIHADAVGHAAFKYNPLVIDHDHVNDRVRGLLCPCCNLGLGQFKDSPEALDAAAAYLRSHQ